MCAHSSDEKFNESPCSVTGGLASMTDPPPRLIHRATRLEGSAFVAVLFVMTAVPAAHASPNFQTILRKAPTSEHTDADTLNLAAHLHRGCDECGPDGLCGVWHDGDACFGTTCVGRGGVQPAMGCDPVRRRPRGPERDGNAAFSDMQETWGYQGDGEVMTHPGPNDTNHNTFVVDNDPEEPCSGGDFDPVPVEVEVAAVPYRGRVHDRRNTSCY